MAFLRAPADATPVRTEDRRHPLTWAVLELVALD
jgi:hypothetical protein